jgi:predicted alpha/beta superfamily hydrolase
MLIWFAAFACAPAIAQPSAAQGLAPRRTILFETTQTTSVGQSIYVLGDLPELGGNDMTRAVKLEPGAYPIWRVSVSLPAGASATYRFVRRSDGPGQTSQPANGTFLTSPTTLNVEPLPNSVPSKVLVASWNVARPLLWHRPANTGQPFASRAMSELGPAVSGRVNETQWFAWNFAPSGAAGGAYDFYLTDSQGGSRYPASGFYSTNLDGAFLQDGQLYSYTPAAVPLPARRAYNPATPPTLFSPQLNETRAYRVFLPRGYDQHPARAYPVLYMHDGQNIFESGPFGSWNAATTLINLQASAQMREVIVVALDNGPNRIRDYLPPTDSFGGTGRGDAYLAYIRDTVKPVIDAQYRTLPNADTTGIMGSSMGGVISLYAGWDFTNTFTRAGLLSGAWQTCPNYLNRVRTTPARAIRMYIDSGDSGTSSDNYWPTLNLRDYFVGGLAPGYSIEGTLRHVIGYNQQHNEAAWAARLPQALTFLYPAQEEPNAVLREVFNASLDRNADARVSPNDAYLAQATPADLNLDGTLTDADPALQFRHLRRFERRELLSR